MVLKTKNYMQGLQIENIISMEVWNQKLIIISACLLYQILPREGRERKKVETGKQWSTIYITPCQEACVKQYNFLKFQNWFEEILVL